MPLQQGQVLNFMITIATPFLNRFRTTQLWLEAFKRLDIPNKKEVKIVWLDLSDNPETADLLLTYKRNNEADFASFVYLTKADVNKVLPDYLSTDIAIEETGSAIPKRQAVAETMNILNSHREGDLVIWEDDIIAPPNSLTRILSLLDTDENCLAFVTTQYSRNGVWLNKPMIWNYQLKHHEEAVGFADHIYTYNENPLNWNMRNLLEKKTGIDFIQACATGFIYYKEEFIKDYVFHSEGGFGQDVMVGFDLNNVNKASRWIDKRLMIIWDLKCVHVAEDNGNIKLFRGKQGLCKTIVYDTNGLQL